mgnify:CR=1 FL=1
MIDYDAPDFSDILVRRGAGKGDIEPINNLMSAYKAASGMQFVAQDYSKICGITLYGDKAGQQIGIRDTQTFFATYSIKLKNL